MYSRSFYPPEQSGPPENYNGTVFSENIPVFEESSAEEVTQSEPVFSGFVSEEPVKKNESAASVGLFGLPFLSGLSGGSFSFDKLFSDFGLEEILILAIAAFLFFSKDGDSECALLLLLLLFVK